MRVAVIGAGLGGLSAAARLVGSGHDVTVYERSDVPGGRAGLIAEQGFRLDPGPTVLTMPRLLADTFESMGREIADYVQIDRVDPMYRANFADGSTLYVRHGREAMADEIRAFSGPADAAGFDDFCGWLTELYQIEMPNYIDTNFDSFADLLRPWRAGIRLARLGGFSRLGSKVESFFDDERLRRVFSFQSMYAGLAPHAALALFSVITYMDAVEGVFAARGGMHNVAAGLARAVQDAGAEFKYGRTVSRILRAADGSVSGIELDDSERIVADAVVCNADLPVAYRTLLGGVERPRVVRRGQYSPSCLLWTAGVRGDVPSGAAQHNLHFGQHWKSAFDELARGRRMSDPSMMVTISDDSDQVPHGHAALSALEPVPNLRGKIDWSESRDQYVADLQRRVAGFGYPVDVVVERVVDPLDWEAMGLEAGTPFSLAHRFRQSGPFRPGNIDARVPGLVFSGAGTVPGVGVPMVLISGKLAADRVTAYAKATATVRW